MYETAKLPCAIARFTRSARLQRAQEVSHCVQNPSRDPALVNGVRLRPMTLLLYEAYHWYILYATDYCVDPGARIVLLATYTRSDFVLPRPNTSRLELYGYHPARRYH